MCKEVYLDYAATTPCDPDVVKAMLPYFNDTFGNPSSLYSLGQKSKKALEGARTAIADTLSADPTEIIFTSGGSESNNMAIKGIGFGNKDKGNHIITTAIEHHSIINACRFMEKQGFKVDYIPVDRYGMVNPDDVRKAVSDNTILISVMHANNEVGTIQPVKEIAEIARARGIYMHTDAVQSFGHIPVDTNELGVNLVSISAHKLYGPRGVGALYVRKGTKIEPFIHGGGQERRRRSSTENLAGIVGLKKAVEISLKSMESEATRLCRMRDRLTEGILSKIPDTRLNGHPEKRLPGNVNISVECIEGESMVLSLDMEGVACSTGSACSSASLEPSHVLIAMGLPPEVAHGSLRFTLGRYTEDEDIDYVLDVLPGIVERLRKMSPMYKEVR